MAEEFLDFEVDYQGFYTVDIEMRIIFNVDTQNENNI